MKIKELVPLIVIISVTLAIGGILIASHVLPEETVKNFNPLNEISLKTNLKVIKTPTPGDNTFIYTLNPVAEQALHIALNDSKVKQTIDEQKGKAVTIAESNLLRFCKARIEKPVTAPQVQVRS